MSETKAEYVVGDRLAERHYVIDPPIDDPDSDPDDYLEFAECTPDERLTVCAVCAATTTDELRKIRRRWQVAHECWNMFSIVDSEGAARAVIAEQREYCDDGCPHPFTVTPLWMVWSEIDSLPEWLP